MTDVAIGFLLLGIGMVVVLGIVFAITAKSLAIAIALALVALLVSPLIFPRSLTHASARTRRASVGRRTPGSSASTRSMSMPWGDSLIRCRASAPVRASSTT